MLPDIPPARTLAPGQSCRILVADPATGETTLIHESTERLYEAPNWSAAGELILNGDGVLWSLTPEPGATPERIEIEGIPPLNNDHVLAPDGETIFLSANDWHIYAAPLAGGTASRITPEDGALHFLHGVSPDGATLAYIRIEIADGAWSAGRVFAIETDGTGDRALTVPGQPADGSEYTPDGEWIYLNTEQFTPAPGHAQIARMRPDGSGIEQLTFDASVNWFPHVSPDGALFYYISFPSGTIGHPADLPVSIKLVRDGDWAGATTVASFLGGQGSINVNGWAPDSSAFAYVEYPIA